MRSRLSISARSIRSCLAIAAVAAIAASCAATPSATSSPGSTTAWSQTDLPEHDPAVFWVNERTVGITTYGSHDCMREPVSLARVDAATLRIDWAPFQTGPCDSGVDSVTYQAPLPEGLDTTRPITVETREGVTDTLPATS
jgi:hypothetical protein